MKLQGDDAEVRPVQGDAPGIPSLGALPVAFAGDGAMGEEAHDAAHDSFGEHTIPTSLGFVRNTFIDFRTEQAETANCKIRSSTPTADPSGNAARRRLLLEKTPERPVPIQVPSTPEVFQETFRPSLPLPARILDLNFLISNSATFAEAKPLVLRDFLQHAIPATSSSSGIRQ